MLTPCAKNSEKIDDSRISGGSRTHRRSSRVVDSEAIYNYTSRIQAVQRTFHRQEAEVVAEFLNALEDCGLSKGRISFYACRLPRIVKWFGSRNIALKGATKDDCKVCLREVIASSDYGGETKSAYAKTLKRLIHFAKTSEIGEKKDGNDYVQEVAWMRPSAYLKQGKKREIKPSDILTYQEFEKLCFKCEWSSLKWCS